MDEPNVYAQYISLISAIIVLPKLPKLRKLPVSSLSSICTDMVIYGAPGTIESTTGINFNSHVRSIVAFPKYIISQLVGHMLGDGSLVMS
jgi:hypothetical protein